MTKEFWGCTGCDHSGYNEFCTECGTCVNGSNYEKSCCYTCDGCTHALFNDGDWVCELRGCTCEDLDHCDDFKWRSDRA